MRRLMMTLAVLLVATAATAETWTRSGDGNDCTPRNFGFNKGRTSYVTEETFDAPTLRTVAVKNSPVSIRGGSARGYSITVCKAAVNQSDLADIKVSIEGGTLVTRGPSDNDDWQVTYKIQAPNGAILDVETRNGPLAIRNLEGRLNVKLKNGPLALDNVSGDVEAQTENGPVSIDGGSGNVKVRASNGPLSVTLEGASWEGGTLDASTHNGPLSVKVSRSFNSGVVVEADGHGPISCRAEACEGQYREYRRSRRDGWNDEPRRFELGRGPQAVRVSTVNGPVTIKDAD
jgi:hypothetical protein